METLFAIGYCKYAMFYCKQVAF